MSATRHSRLALRDILEAIHEIEEITADAPVPQLRKLSLHALLYGLLKISEAVRHLPDELKGTRPDISWSQIAQLGID